ncbi:flagellar type III secretion system protein FlhA [Vibrio sp. OCN044]|uniref:Flagellar type III secretion system protein FlhA n=2 Tax=Vibrio tetraodonis TaxID=2231647 RepID=A0A6L8LWZ3_9VIBR|nr:flagellar type III secretion system protein FlhA [Vibrio tetraodonis subsp. pristinus]
MFKDYLIKDWTSNLFIIGVVLILMVVFLPVPPGLLDFLQIVNFSVALLILLLTFCTDKPLSFSTFPSIILIATLFRLALNISATRLILGDGDAGEVIAAIGEFVVSGNYIIGFIVFIILVVVQYVVVTNGAQRVAEVAARFTLDSMPGKQMAIDADMNMGLIDEHEAKERRATIEKEANFYGAMDGATKFVKGDAIAGIIIILIDIIGGVAVGVTQNNMSWSDALTLYSLLTVGDGIVTQIPSLIIAVATGIIITRAATDYELSHEIGKQVSSHPRTLILVTFALIIALALGVLPTLPLLLAIGIFGACVFWAIRANEKSKQPTPKHDTDKESLNEIIKVYPIEVVLAPTLKEKWHSVDWNLDSKLEALKISIAKDFGFIFPDVHVRSCQDIETETYEIYIHGARYARGALRPTKTLAIGQLEHLKNIQGEKTKEPAYGLPALWIDDDQKTLAQSQSCTLVDAGAILFTHVSETLKTQMHDIISRADVENLLSHVRSDNSSLVDEVVPQVMSLSDIHQVLRLLLAEKVSIRHIELILEVCSENSELAKTPTAMVEKVRERLALRICSRYLDPSDSLNVITMSPIAEARLKLTLDGNVGEDSNGPSDVENVISQLVAESEGLISKGLEPVLLCSSALRLPLRQITERVIPKLAVLSALEVKGVSSVKTVGQVKL